MWRADQTGCMSIIRSGGVWGCLVSKDSNLLDPTAAVNRHCEEPHEEVPAGRLPLGFRACGLCRRPPETLDRRGTMRGAPGWAGRDRWGLWAFLLPPARTKLWSNWHTLDVYTQQCAFNHSSMLLHPVFSTTAYWSNAHWNKNCCFGY